MIAEELRRCLEELDVPGIRRIWSFIVPGQDQPSSDHDARVTMHLARVEMKTIPVRAKEYSRAWLAEHHPIARAVGVGVAVGQHGSVKSELQINRHGAMVHSVELSVRDGLDLTVDAPEVTRRMRLAKARA